MRKEEFLTTLKKNLSMLEEKEVQDIVEEYEQHIDMKMQGGLSEEAAIADFGNLKELTAGILEAYHVKSDYQPEKKKIDYDKVKEESKKATEALGKSADALGKGIGKGVGAIGKGIGKSAGACGRGIQSFGKWCKDKWTAFVRMLKKPFADENAVHENGDEERVKKGIVGKTKRMIAKVFRGIWNLMAWCVGFLWDMFWICIGLFFGIGALFCVFMLGVSVVLLVCGYPLIGVTIAILGGGAVCTALTMFALMLLNVKPEEVKTHA